jgi:hypothetical protein
MSLFRFKDAPTVSSTPFSEFIRTASSEEKKKVYSNSLRALERIGTVVRLSVSAFDAAKKLFTESTVSAS